MRQSADHPRLTVVTVCRNTAADLEDTLASIERQDYALLESVVVDGASTDRTPEVLQRFTRLTASAISEPDKGVYDAMNKGLARSRGEVIHFLNAGDRYHGGDAATRAMAALDASGADVLVGDSVFFRGDRVRRKAGRRFGRTDAFVRSWNHQAVFMRADALRRLGGFDTALRIFADQDLLLRAKEAGLKFHDEPTPLVEFRFGDRDYSDDLPEKLKVVRAHGHVGHVAVVWAVTKATRLARRLRLYDF